MNYISVVGFEDTVLVGAGGANAAIFASFPSSNSESICIRSKSVSSSSHFGSKGTIAASPFWFKSWTDLSVMGWTGHYLSVLFSNMIGLLTGWSTSLWFFVHSSCTLMTYWWSIFHHSSVQTSLSSWFLYFFLLFNRSNKRSQIRPYFADLHALHLDQDTLNCR